MIEKFISTWNLYQFLGSHRCMYVLWLHLSLCCISTHAFKPNYTASSMMKIWVCTLRFEVIFSSSTMPWRWKTTACHGERRWCDFFTLLPPARYESRGLSFYIPYKTLYTLLSHTFRKCLHAKNLNQNLLWWVKLPIARLYFRSLYIRILTIFFFRLGNST